MKWLFALLCLGYCTVGFAQTQTDSVQVDDRYLEDQFYLGLTYNFVLNKPEGVSQSNLSYGLQAGFIKDIPLNYGRNTGLGIGLGYAVYSYYTNLGVMESGDSFEYRVLDGTVPYKRNKLETHLIEMPVEVRFRNSTPTDYKFWRLYAGFKLGYIVGSRSKLVADTYKTSFYNTDTRNFRYGLTLNIGYNTFNIHVYYALNDLFEEGTVTTEGEPIDFRPLRIGLIFYIL